MCVAYFEGSPVRPGKRVASGGDLNMFNFKIRECSLLNDTQPAAATVSFILYNIRLPFEPADELQPQD